MCMRVKVHGRVELGIRTRLLLYWKSLRHSKDRKELCGKHVRGIQTFILWYCSASLKLWHQAAPSHSACCLCQQLRRS